MDIQTGMSLWSSVSVCSLIRLGNSSGPRAEGEQRYQMDSARGATLREKHKVDKREKWTGIKTTTITS